MIKSISKKKGYTLLFAVLTSIMVLSIAAFILSISRKQFILTSSARDSVYAFYAADTGLECAIRNLYALSTSTYDGNEIKCGGAVLNSNIDPSAQPKYVEFYMPMDMAQSQGPGCTWVRVTQETVANKQVTKIISRGYNIGWKNSSRNCTEWGPRKVERGIQISIIM